MANYWAERMKALEEVQYTKTTEYYDDLREQFHRAENEMQKETERWYRRLAENNDISYAAAKKLLTKDELKEFHWTVQEYIKRGKENALDQQWEKQLENASARVHINRLEVMKLQIQQHAEELYQEYERETRGFLKEIYQDSYYRTAYEIAKKRGIDSTFSSIDTRKLDKVIKTPWAQDGRFFSDRIWQNKDRLVGELHSGLVQSLIRGDNLDVAAKHIKNTMGCKLSQARTLVYTESAAVASIAQKESLKELDVEQFEVVETLDSHTCKTCGGMDGKHFKMTDFEVGVTAPPFHPNCRGCTCPYFDDEFGSVGERAARGEDGKIYYVPADMTYEDWKKSFVDGDTEARDRLGLFTNNNRSDPKYYDFEGKDLETVEQEISQNDYETAVIFDDGKAISCQLGNEDTIKFTKHQLKVMKGKDVTHNHPLSTPPSPEDLYLLVDHKAKSFRTCGKNGTYVLEYCKEVEKLPGFDVFEKKYSDILSDLMPKYANKYGYIENQDSLISLGNEIWEELYKVYGVKPRFERR